MEVRKGLLSLLLPLEHKHTTIRAFHFVQQTRTRSRSVSQSQEDERGKERESETVSGAAEAGQRTSSEGSVTVTIRPLHLLSLYWGSKGAADSGQ